MSADDIAGVVRATGIAEQAALAHLLDTRRLIHQRASEHEGRLPLWLEPLVDEANVALAAHVCAVADSAEAFRAWSQAREREEDAEVLEAQAGQEDAP